MQQTIDNQLSPYENQKQTVKQTVKLKKRCLLKKKVQGQLQKINIDDFSSRCFHVYNIIYLDFNVQSDCLSSDPNFIHQIFNFYTIAKVTKNRDRTILSLKLCSKLSKFISIETPSNDQSELLKKPSIAQFNVLSEKNVLSHYVQKIHNTLHQQQQALNLKSQDENIKSFIYLTQQKVSQKIEELLSKINTNQYIIFENIFKPTHKRIKNIHFSNNLLDFIGQNNQNLAFELLKKNTLPFQIFKKFNKKNFTQNALEHFSKLLEKLFTLQNAQNHFLEETFQMEGVTQEKDTKERTFTLKWTCSHPSIILIEFFEKKKQQGKAPKDQQITFSTRFQDLKIE